MKKIKILVVENEPGIEKDIRNTLLKIGYDVLDVVNTGTKAIEMVEELKPDLILMDTTISEKINGIDTSIQIHEKSDVPVLFLSSESDEITFKRTMETRPYGYLIKPVSRNDLYTAIEISLQRYKIEKKIQASRERYRMIVQNANEGIIIAQDGIVKFANPKMTEISGYSQEENASRPFIDFVHPDDKKMLIERYRKRIKGEKIEPVYPFRIIDKDGNIKWLEINSTLSSWNGKPATLNFLNDITERMQAKKALRDSETRFKYLVENAHDIIYYTNETGHFASLNPVSMSILGYSEEEIIGKHYLDLIRADYRKETERFYKDQYEKKIPSTYYEFPALTKKGKEIWLGQNVQLVMEDDHISGFQAIAREITVHKLAEEQSKQSIDQLRLIMNGIIQAITRTVEVRDPFTAGHHRKVANLARAIANELALPKNQVEGIRVASIIHDLGKISIPAEILSKPGKILDIEFNIIKIHPSVGFDILKNIEFPWPIAQIVLQHHERIDGSGYPDGLMGKDILIEAKIIGVADVVEAIASHRPYRASLGIEKALEEIDKNKNILFDPDIVDACIRIIKEKRFNLDEIFHSDK